ncbi:variable large family protein (plasmid) [Borrelia coriaceae]|uniref:Variable large protein n=1 Tax=Borrelia coriaceae ATCC 43381 TaxID=1408429 RepID=W5SXQ1_9SPIR|nr:Variable major outer membrane lipoprotein [Borrelia coriaceae ATCC 43381]UPA17313.1 variable large family protein [Borrelia coriaceae]UPA17499.1 variable large family protein [Borrelia coriaceae]
MKINIKNISIRSICATLFISLFLSCNNGIEELEKKKDSILFISNLKQGFLDIFTSFSDMVTSSFGITAETTKKDVGGQLGKIGDAVKSVKDKLEGIKGNEQYDLIKKAKADEAINNSINILEKIVEGANKIKDATDGASKKIASSNGDGESATPASEKSVQELVKGISEIYKAAKDAKIDLKGNANKTITESNTIAKLFNTNSQVGSDVTGLKAANMAVNSASGADILAAIEAAKDGTSKKAGAISAATNAYDIAVATKDNANANASVSTNASVLAAGLALRAMAKDGALATVATYAPTDGINAVLIEAVSKTLNEIISTIRRTLDKCLKDVSDCIKENSTSEGKT